MGKVWRRVAYWICGIVIFILCGVLGYLYFTQPLAFFSVKEFNSFGSVPIDRVLSKEEVSSDIDEIVTIMESTHPIFLEAVSEEYFKVKDNLLSLKGKEMRVSDLQSNIGSYLASIDDGHTSIGWNEKLFIDVKWRFKDGKLYLLNDYGITDGFVVSIGGISIDKIFEVVNESFPSENNVSEAKNIERYAKGLILLEKAGIEINDDILMRVNLNGEVKDIKIKTTKDSYYNYGDRAIYFKLINEDIAYVRLGICEVNQELIKVVDEIKSHKEIGVKNFIIDVSDNSGGNSEACSMILNALDMEGGNYSVVTRFSELAREQRGYLRKSGSIEYKGKSDGKKNNDINLYVITNENTFSSAQMLAVWVSDGELGKLIGRASSNMPSSYGDVLGFKLSNSGLVGQISHKKWIRPDKNKVDERVLEPDIYVEFGEDILERVLEEIR